MSDTPTAEVDREEDECPQCSNQGYENPVLDDTYECNNCVIAFNAEGEVLDSA